MQYAVCNVWTDGDHISTRFYELPDIVDAAQDNSAIFAAAQAL